MLISEPMRVALNQQIGNEFGASLQYVAIAAHFDHESLTELAAHYYLQAEEERNHAMRFVRYLIDATENTLRWFVTEQLEEVHGAQSLLRVVRRAGENGILQVEDYLVRHKASRRSTGASGEAS